VEGGRGGGRRNGEKESYVKESCINTIVSITLQWVWVGFCETHQCDSVH
jgi:hypothetical protein